MPRLLLGFVPLDEGRQDGATAAILDLSVKSGFMIECKDGSFCRALNANGRRLYNTGDRKSNECASAGLTTMSNVPVSFERSSEQAQEFIGTLEKTFFAPGDWHTGLNFLKSIFKVHYHHLLKTHQRISQVATNLQRLQKLLPVQPTHHCCTTNSLGTFNTV